MLNRQPSRRVLTRGLAWSVPVVVVGAPVPATAASGGSGGIRAECGSGRTGSFVLDVTGSSSPYVAVTFSHSGSGSFSVSVPSGWLLSSGDTYLAPVVDGMAQGTAQVTFTLGQNGTGTVTASITTSPGQEVTGPRVAGITKRRSGNSSNYTCSTS